MRGSKVLILGFTWPEPSSTAAGTRMMQLIQFFKERNCSVIFACATKKQEHALNLSEINVQTANIKLNDTSFDRFVAELQPNITIFDRFLTEEQFGWRVAEFAPNSLRILDTEDLHSLRKIREEAVNKKQDFELNQWMTSLLTKRELASIFRCDLSLIISSFEYRLLTEKIKVNKSLLMHLPFTVEKINIKEQSKCNDFKSRQHFISIGNGLHKPNVDALIFLKKKSGLSFVKVCLLR